MATRWAGHATSHEQVHVPLYVTVSTRFDQAKVELSSVHAGRGWPLRSAPRLRFSSVIRLDAFH